MPQYTAMVGVLVVVMSVVFAVLMIRHQLQEWLGSIVLEVLTRLFGQILVAIAVQLVVEGLGQVFTEWINPESVIMDNLQSETAENGNNGGAQ